MSFIVSFLDDTRNELTCICLICGASTTVPAAADEDGSAEILLRHRLDCAWGELRNKKEMN